MVFHYRSPPDIIDQFAPDLTQLSQDPPFANRSCTLNRFSSNEDENIKLFEVFEPSTVPCSSPLYKHATIVLVHGWGEHLGRYHRLSQQLADNGYHVYRYDQRSHGHSSGRPAFVTMEENHADLEQVLTQRVPLYVKPLLCSSSESSQSSQSSSSNGKDNGEDSVHNGDDNVENSGTLDTNEQQSAASSSSPLSTSPHKIFLFGHSLGGFTIVSYELLNQGYDKLQETSEALLSSFAISGLITSNAALALGKDITSSRMFPITARVAPILGRFLPSLPVQQALSAQYLTRNEASVAEYVADAKIYKGPFLAGPSAHMLGHYTRIQQENLYARMKKPILIMYGTDDLSVNPEGSINLYNGASSTDKQLIKYEGFYHELLQEPEADRVLADILQWLNNHCTISQ